MRGSLRIVGAGGVGGTRNRFNLVQRAYPGAFVTLPGRMAVVPNMTTSSTDASDGAVELAIATIFKNEAPYLREWIEFHRLVGVERFYLYDNGSDDGSRDVLEPYQRVGTVVITEWPRHPGQISAYTHCAHTYADDAAWIAFIDIDEFFFAPDGQDLRVVLAEFDRPGIGGIGVNYADFGTSGHLTRPRSLVIESYLHRVGLETCIPLPHLLRGEGLDPADPASYHLMCAHVSSVVRPGRVLSFRSSHYADYHTGAHAVTENGDPTQGPLTERVSMRRLRMNHYWTKSVEESKQKCLRGRSDNGETRAWPHEFVLRERAMRELDVGILRYLEPLRNALGVDGPSVDALVADAVERVSSWSPEIVAHEPALASAPASCLSAMKADEPEPLLALLRRQLEDVSLQKRELETRLSKVELDLRSARNELSELSAQIDAMTRSRSWRITAPLRRVRRLMQRR